MHLLGVVELQSGRFAQAAGQLARATEVDARRADVWNHLAIAYSKLGKHEAAITAFERAVGCDATTPDVHFNLALAYSRNSRTEEAIASLRRAIALRSDFAEAHGKLGKLLRDRGDLVSAVESLRTAASLRPNDARLQKTLDGCLERLQQDQGPPISSRFARQLLLLCEESQNSPVADGDSSCIDERLFFAFGTPKSGTTWVQMLLDAHPEVACRPEDQFAVLFDGAERLVEGYNKVLAEVDRRTANQGADVLTKRDAAYLTAALIRRTLGKRIAETGIRRAGAKDNAIVTMLDGFARHFATSQFVFVVRDPRDVAVSSWFHNLRVEQDFERRAGTLAQWAQRIASTWCKDASAVLESSQQLGDRLHIVRYEDLHAQSESTLRELFAFLRVDLTPRTARQCLAACSFERRAQGRATGTEDRSSFFRRGVCGDWRNHLDGQVTDEFVAIAGDVMSRFDYR